MKIIQQTQIASWKSENTSQPAIRHYNPHAVDLICHNCGKSVTFSLTKWDQTPYQLRVASAQCPRCRGRATFLLLNHRSNSSDFDPDTTMWVHPSAEEREPIADLGAIDEFSEQLLCAYESTLNVFNAKEWNATAVLARRLLEGITKNVLPEKDHNLTLSKQLEKLPAVKDLSLPIKNLAAEIRKGGNLGAHFDLEKEPDEDISRLMIDLIEDLIEYLFIIPLRIEELSKKLESLSSTEEAS